MRNPGGYLYITEPGVGPREADTFTCGHCQRIVVVPAKASPTDLGGLCGCCAALICSHCVDLGTCLPVEKALAAAEASYHARRSYEA